MERAERGRFSNAEEGRERERVCFMSILAKCLPAVC